MSITFANPATVHSPQGLYSHTARVGAGSELLFLAGQVGVRPDGSTPADLAGQADQVFANIAALLAAQGYKPSDIVKLTMFIVAGQDIGAVRQARQRVLGEHKPTSTAVFVSQLADPAWFVEVEAVAAKAAG